MRAVSNLLIENRGLMIAAAALAFFVAAVLILLVFRLAFGRRLRTPGGRARQMRLGFVDAFDLDRQRQLVIVRRDNVEHLVMIGGPNDLLIESQIIRNEARSRDKDMRDRETAHVAAAKPPVVEPKVAIPPSLPEPQPVAAMEHYLAHAPYAQPPMPAVAPIPTAAPLMPGPGPRRTPLKPVPVAPVVDEPPPGLAEAGGARPPQQMPTARPAAGSGPAAPGFANWPGRPGPSATPTGPTPMPKVAPQQTKRPAERGPERQPETTGPQGRTTSPRPNTKPAATTAEPPTAWPPVPSSEGLESLEEEMAKLLGRGPNKQ